MQTGLFRFFSKSAKDVLTTTGYALSASGVACLAYNLGTYAYDATQTYKNPLNRCNSESSSQTDNNKLQCFPK